MMSRDPAVTVVHAHLEGEHHVMYPSNATDEFRRQCANDAVSDLMRYLKRPLDHIFNPLTLLDYFESYTITTTTTKTRSHSIFRAAWQMVGFIR